MMSKREMCLSCQLPCQHCICSSAIALSSTLTITVLQHPDEQSHPKNTLRLARLCLPNIRVYVGETAEDFSHIARQCSVGTDKVCVIFPSQTSRALEQHSSAKLDHLIFIDATWRKAFKMWSLNTWLQTLPCYHFTQAPASRYQLRKTSRAQGLSSLEAIAYGLSVAEGLEVSPLHAIQQSWIEQKRAMMPRDVQHRYEP